jgi:hypothetical protein
MMVILLRGHPPHQTNANLGLDIEEKEDGERMAMVVILMILTWRRTIDEL